MSYISDIQALQPLLAAADHVDIKHVEGDVTLREFVVASLSYYPSWVRLLYRVRAGFVRLLGMRQAGMPKATALQPDTLPMTPGAQVSFFKVRLAAEEQYWVAEAKDHHLDAALGVVAEPLGNGRRRFHVLTIVHYNNWAGPVYFNVIRPFHHLVVGGMARAGVATPGVRGQGSGVRGKI